MRTQFCLTDCEARLERAIGDVPEFLFLAQGVSECGHPWMSVVDADGEIYAHYMINRSNEVVGFNYMSPDEEGGLFENIQEKETERVA